jgi:TraM recognition site of TraD and TraG
LQLVVGKRYESEEERRKANRPLLSVVLDEFAPFGYRNFPQILQTARGTNTAFLFSMQSLPQLMHVGRGFKEDVASAPNTTMTLRTRDEETARYFLRASAEHQVTRRSLSMERWKFFGYEHYEETGRAVDVQATETRALDEHIKNLPKGQMEILMTDDTQGTLHAHLHVRPPADVRVPHFVPMLYPRLKQSRMSSMGANLRFKSAELVESRSGRRMHWDQKMKRAVHCAALMIVLAFSGSGVWAQTPRRPYTGRDTWYEFMLKQFNPRNVDYGAWLEKRREAFLEATAREPHFWYSLSVTTGLFFVLVAYTKLYLDHRRSMRITAEMMADIYTHDLYSRQAAKEAIEKYNRHIEHCNRAIEAAESGESRPGWGDTAVGSLKAELQRVAAQLEATTQDRNKLQEELRRKALIVADLSTRLDNLAKKVNGFRGIDSTPAASAPGDGNGDGARFVGHINRLQEELYAERQKNKRLKGA